MSQELGGSEVTASCSQDMLSRWYRLIGSDDSSMVAQLPSLDNRGLAYGDGFFTTMRVAKGSICWLGGHIERIDSHARRLSIPINTAELDRLTDQLCYHAQQLSFGTMKLIMTRAVQSGRGYGFVESGADCEAWLRVSPEQPGNKRVGAILRLPDDTAVTVQPAIYAVCLTAKIAWLPATLVGLKSLNRLDSVLASAELQRRRVSAPSDALPLEGLVRDVGDNWVEGTMSNVFYQLNGSDQWFTPPIDRSGVQGIMRGVIIAATTVSQPVIERRLTDPDLPALSRLLFCNAVRGVMPVDELMIRSPAKTVSLQPLLTHSDKVSLTLG